MQAEILHVTLLKPTVSILFEDWFLCLCEMRVACLKSIKEDVTRILTKHWNPGGTGDIPGKVSALMENTFVLLFEQKLSSIMLRFTIKYNINYTSGWKK